jgi:ribonuclease HII
MGARERARMLFTERALWAVGLSRVAGVDEVGIGPLAGPVVAAAVVLPCDVALDGIRDSKLLSARQRDALEGAIRETALGIGVGVVEVEEVDRLNVYRAGLAAMARAVQALPLPPEHLLVDARQIPDCTISQTSVARGDRTVYSIAAASIVAKVYRDRLMVAMDGRYPGYGFARHAGYGTAAHLRALRSLGPTPIHRRSFAPVRDVLLNGSWERPPS